MSRRWSVLSLVTLGIACLAPSAAASWQNYRAGQDGPPGTVVNAIAQGRRGEIAFGTDNGVGIFDGDQWTVLRDSLPSKVVNALLQDRSGVWWFALSSVGLNGGGVARFDGSRWTITGLGSQLPSPNDLDVKALLEDHAGDIWIATAAGLIRRRAGTDVWDHSPTANLTIPSAWALFEDHRHRLWVGSSSGASMADPTRSVWTHYRATPGALERDTVFAFTEDRDGGIWFGSYDGAAYRLDPDGSWSSHGVGDGLPRRDVKSLARDSTGAIWFGFGLNFPATPGPAGVVRFDGRTFEAFPGPGGGDFGPVYGLLVDDPGNLWVATSNTGVYRSDASRIEPYVTDTGQCLVRDPATLPTLHRELPSNCHAAMLQDHEGALWFATADAGAARLGPDGGWSRWTVATGRLVTDSLTALLEDRGGRLWIGTATRGAQRIDAARTGSARFDGASGLTDDDVVASFEDARGDVWIGTANGVSRFDGSAWTSQLRSAAPGGGAVRVEQILEDTTHTVWLRTDQGLWSVDAARTGVTRHTQADGLPDDFVNMLARGRDGTLWVGCDHGLARRTATGWTLTAPAEFGRGFVRTIHEDGAARLWVGTNFGLAYRAGSTWRIFSAPQLGLGEIRQVLEDQRGRIWAAGPGGVTRWNGDTWRSLSIQDGLGAPDTDELLEDSQGRLWARGYGGLTLLVPDRVGPQTLFRLPPPVITTSRNVSFAFGAAYGETADLEFEAVADGLAEPWSPATTFSMQNLADGTHTFTVRSRDWSRNLDPTPAAVTFEVDATPPQAVISAPQFRAPVRGIVAVEGSSEDARYVSHRLEVSAAGRGAWQPIATSAVPVSQDTLALWDTSAEADGEYDLRLSVQDALGLVGTALVRVIVDNRPPFADVTSPVHVIASTGGDVFTTGAEVHAYLPPLALDADATVSVEADTLATGDGPSDGAQLAGGVWRLAWPGANLVHAGVLEMRPGAGESRTLAVYGETTPGTWQRLGGAPTAAGAPYSVPLAAPGRYALFAGGDAAAARGVSGITLVPRAFSPNGSFGSRDVAIGFTLARAGSVSVKVYNRAGRLLRVVADGLGMPAGAGVVRWDGRDRDAHVVEEGLYLVTVEALGERTTRTLAVLR